ncbi:MAG TPA: type II toxin-antitoxin system VapC family toxin [Solirubrobacterales bacterium]|jgi:predicted nucleic acid-binding protein|nr:type II toxin-antitoxin system VapC family toxin [Solirubrobacterales bacterium]
MPVIDASVLAEYLSDAEGAEVARRRLIADRTRLWAPHLVDAEVGHALRRGVRRGEIAGDAAGDALDDLIAMPLRRVRHRELIPRAWELRENVSFYDALYVSLAELLDQPLITFDGRLARANGVRAEIEVLT